MFKVRWISLLDVFRYRIRHTRPALRGTFHAKGKYFFANFAKFLYFLTLKSHSRVPVHLRHGTIAGGKAFERQETGRHILYILYSIIKIFRPTLHQFD